MSCDYRKTLTERLDTLSFPCGKCASCRKQRVDNWAMRLTIQHENSNSYHWVTLTYANPPITNNGFMSLYRRDFTNFIKRLRKLSGKNVKYYAAGEYGTGFDRPHYHALIFNSTQNDIITAWEGFKSSPLLNDEKLRTFKNVVNGYVYFDPRPFSTSSVAYISFYTDKGVSVPIHGRDDRYAEFQAFSTGLGAQYLTPQMIKYHHDNPERLFYTKNGFKKPLPRYFKNKLNFSEETLIALQAKAAQAAIDKISLQFDEYTFRNPNKHFAQSLQEAKEAHNEAFFNKRKSRKSF